jgi:hypothetical protein
VPRAAKPFFIPMFHSPPRAMRHVTTLEFPSQDGRAPSRGTRGSTRAPLSGRQSLEPWDTWQHRSSPLKKAETGAGGTHDSAGAHLNKEVRSEAARHVAASELPSQEGRTRSHGLCGSAWMKDRRRQPDGGEWEPIKIPIRNLAYILKSTQSPFLLTRPRPPSYRQAISLQNRARNHSRSTKQC